MNSKGHLYISLIKSALRIVGCVVVCINKSIIGMAALFAIAELLGITEELVDKR